MKKILFVSYGGGHVNLLLPVFIKCKQNADYRCEYLALTTAGNELRAHDLPCLGFRDLIGDCNVEALAYGRELVGNKHEAMTVPYEESVAYMGLSFWDLVHQHGEEEAYRIYREQGGRQAFYPVASLRRYLEESRPDLVVATNSPRSERAAIDAAAQLGIPSICVVDLFAFQEIKWIGRPGFADKVCVLSEFVRNAMITAGRSSEEVVVTGNPAFDSLSVLKNSNARSEFRLRKGWKDDETVVLWASNVEPAVHPFSTQTGDPQLPCKVEQQLESLVHSHSSIRVVIRPHPNDERNPKTIPGRIDISTAKDDIGELLMAVDCVIVLSSTVGLQAALMDKPLVNINLSIFSKDAPYDDMGISVGVSDLENLNSAILQALSEGQSGRGLPDIGSATDNVVNVIEDLLREGTC